MVRITDPEKSRAFYEALGFRFERDMDIVRNGELEATNYFYGIGDSESVLELTFNHDGRTYDLGTGYGHVAVGVDDLEQTLGELKLKPVKRSARCSHRRPRPTHCASQGSACLAGRVQRA